jgi:DNA-binding MarR family transcriptional regulator
VEDPPFQHAAALELGAALYGLAAAVVRRMPREISLTAVATLSALERHGPQRLTQLAALQGVTQPSMSWLVSRLEEEGLAERRDDPTDGRAVLVALTPAGRRYMSARRRHGAERLAAVIRQLEDDQARALRDALPALVLVAQLTDAEADQLAGCTTAAAGRR